MKYKYECMKILLIKIVAWPSKFVSSYCLLHHMRIEMKCLIIFHHIVSSLKTNKFFILRTHTATTNSTFLLGLQTSVLSSLSLSFILFCFTLNFIFVRDNNKFGRLVSAFSSCEIIYGWKIVDYNFVAWKSHQRHQMWWRWWRLQELKQ